MQQMFKTSSSLENGKNILRQIALMKLKSLAHGHLENAKIQIILLK